MGLKGHTSRKVRMVFGSEWGPKRQEAWALWMRDRRR